MTSHRLDIHCHARDGAWVCRVRVGDDPSATQHQVTVSSGDLADLAPHDTDPGRLVRRSFEFLLQREPRESILRAFPLPMIGRYFPDYRAWLREEPPVDQGG